MDKSLDIVDPGPFAAEDDRARSTASFVKAANVKQADPSRRGVPVQEEAATQRKSPPVLTGGLFNSCR